MAKTPIAEIKLAPGEVGYYDEYSKIYLSSANQSAIVYSGTNCTQIKRSIQSGRLRLVRGGFDIEPKANNILVKKNTEAAVKVEAENKVEKVKASKENNVAEVKSEVETAKEENKEKEKVKTEEKVAEVKEEAATEAKAETVEENKKPAKKRNSRKQDKAIE